MTRTALAVVEPLESSRSLSELADIANREHALAVGAGVSMVGHAIRAGKALIAAKDRVPEGEWVRWIASEFLAATSTANRYMRIARNEHIVLEKGLPTIQAADAYLAGSLAIDREAQREAAEDRRRQARDMRDRGASLAEIADLFGVAEGTVSFWLAPSGQRRRKIKRDAERRRVALKAFKRQAAEKAAKTKGGAIGKAYADGERLQDVLGQAYREATDPEARRALAKAGEHYRKMRDEIVRALGAS